MNPKYSKVLFTVFTILTLLAVAATYYKMMVLRDFEIVDDVEEEFIEE